MATDDWTPLPSLWPERAASRTIGKYELLVFTQDVRQSPARGSDLIVSGTADSFDAAKAAAMHEASILTVAKPHAMNAM